MEFLNGASALSQAALYLLIGFVLFGLFGSKPEEFDKGDALGSFMERFGNVSIIFAWPLYLLLGAAMGCAWLIYKLGGLSGFIPRFVSYLRSKGKGEVNQC